MFWPFYGQNREKEHFKWKSTYFFLESFKDLGMKFFWKNLIFNREENNNKDCQLKVQSFF